MMTPKQMKMVMFNIIGREEVKKKKVQIEETNQEVVKIDRERTLKPEKSKEMEKVQNQF